MLILSRVELASGGSGDHPSVLTSHSFKTPLSVIVFLFFFLSGCLTFWINIFEAGISISFGFFNVSLFWGAGN